MVFGVKVKTVKLANKYSLEALYEAIKDKEFTAGKPQWTKHGFAYIITFPALDSHNQVWIVNAGFGKETNKFSIQKAEAAGLDNMASNAIMGGLTRGISNLQGSFSENTKKCEQFVVATAKELSEMGL